MSAIATITCTCVITGLPSGGPDNIDPPVLSVTGALGVKEYVTLASGDNTVTVPTGAKKLFILPNAGNTIQVTFKKVSGDAGFPA